MPELIGFGDWQIGLMEKGIREHQEMDKMAKRVMSRYAPAPLQPVHILLGRIPTGFPGTMRTVEHIKALIRQGSKDFFVRQKAIDILLERNIKPKQYLAEIKALFDWVQRNIRYTKDPFQVEVLHSARRMLELRAGDCDDMAIILGSMLKSIGHPVRLVVAGFDPARPRHYSHIYLEVLNKDHWLPLDATMPFPAGWAPPSANRTASLIEKGLDGPGQYSESAAKPAQQSRSLRSTKQRQPGALLDAGNLYKSFRGFEPVRTVRLSCQRVIPPVVTHLGSLIGLIYRSDKGNGRANPYIHFMENPPILVSDPKGSQLYIIGGNYRVTENGIEG